MYHVKRNDLILESIQNGVVDFNYFLLEKVNRYFARNICHGYYKISNKPI